MKYQFMTTTTMKAYNNNKYWIDAGIIPCINVKADTVNNALNEYADIVNNKYGVDISQNALKHANCMYVDDDNGSPKQTGYVITASCLFDKGDYTGYSKQFVDLWIEVMGIVDVFAA